MRDRPIDISVIVPFLDEEAHIERCLRALLAQDYPPVRREILMVDNGSSDRSAAIVRRFPEVRLIAEPVRGDWAARNAGVRASGGRILAFTDADAAPLPDWLRQLEAALAEPGVRVVVGRLEFAGLSRTLSLLASYEAEKADYVFTASNKDIYYGDTCNLAVSRAVFDEVGPFTDLPRSADVVFVRDVADRWPQGVRFCRDARVCRLDVSSLVRYYRKVHAYGRDLLAYAPVAHVRPLNRTERLRVFGRLVRREEYSWAKSACCFVLLTVGALCYALPRMRTARFLS